VAQSKAISDDNIVSGLDLVNETLTEEGCGDKSNDEISDNVVAKVAYWVMNKLMGNGFSSQQQVA
jgi:hypothetical protein